MRATFFGEDAVASRKKARSVGNRARGRGTAKSLKGASAGSNAHTIIYIHGIGNKPTESVLRCQWDHALFEFPLGERSRMAYWCQEDRHGPPLDTSCGVGDLLHTQAIGAPGFGARALERELSVEEIVDEVARTKRERDSLSRLAKEMERAPASGNGKLPKTLSAKGIEDWDPPSFLVKFLTGLFIKDVRDFFFDEGRRRRMLKSLRDRLDTGGGPFIIIAHSLGSMVAYSLLQAAAEDAYDIALFVTIGSPLGLAEARDRIAAINGLPNKKRLPIPRCVDTWLNFFDEKDPVSRGVELIEFYSRSGAHIQDMRFPNPARPRDPHSATGYLSGIDVRSAVREHVDLQRFQPVAPFTLARDAVTDFERYRPTDRRSLLIELSDPAWARTEHARKVAAAPNVAARRRLAGAKVPDSSPEMAREVEALIREVVGKSVKPADLELVKLRHYVSVRLTRDEAERLANKGLPVRPFYHIWRNAKKVALLERSIHTVQASAAHRSYEAYGHDVQWAVLDSGCTPHAHFRQYDNLMSRWDCTQVSDMPIEHGEPVGKGKGKGMGKGSSRKANADDRYGHGTHVAGIIAGYYEYGPAGSERVISGIAPRTRLHIYKVLNDKGEGEDAWIIKALDHLAEINDKAGAPVIAGVNLSLGGPFDQGVFGCGHTPLCDELRRLWRQGVVVVLAAGNEGFATLISSDGEIPANMDLTISDPANLEDAIAVGAVHKERPHTFGVSYFSSRGPTADGRQKPDCVAPGEQILSCRHEHAAGARSIGELYMKLDGTSMAAPHVSGIIAAFLSRRREFIGHPDRVKEILLANCTDLERERSMQGAGIPNLVKMLVQT
ncbi:MAG: S8 family serine peptidase [Gemmatimonadaceae bacterium]